MDIRLDIWTLATLKKKMACRKRKDTMTISQVNSDEQHKTMTKQHHNFIKLIHGGGGRGAGAGSFFFFFPPHHVYGRPASLWAGYKSG
jgi:hypothetical protein